MRVNDVRLDSVTSPTLYSRSPTHPLNGRMLRKSRPLVPTISNKTKQIEQYHELINKLKLLSLVSSSLPPLSLEEITNNIVKDVYGEYKRLRKLNLNELKESYELFKEQKYSKCLKLLQCCYQASCLIEFLEREYSEIIQKSKLHEKNMKKTLIQRLEEEREEMKQTCKYYCVIFLKIQKIYRFGFQTLTTTINRSNCCYSWWCSRIFKFQWSCVLSMWIN